MKFSCLMLLRMLNEVDQTRVAPVSTNENDNGESV